MAVGSGVICELDQAASQLDSTHSTQLIKIPGGGHEGGCLRTVMIVLVESGGEQEHIHVNKPGSFMCAWSGVWRRESLVAGIRDEINSSVFNAYTLPSVAV